MGTEKATPGIELKQYRDKLKQYRDGEYGGAAMAVQLNDRNFDSIRQWLDATTWENGAAGHVVGLIFGEYEEQVYAPFGWWIVQRGGWTEFLSPAAFEDEYEAC
jgi:hypothetical protein